MNPSEILRLIKSARDLSSKSGRSPEAFLIAYVAWEALKIRILLVGLTSRGLSVREGKLLIQESDIWKHGQYQKLFRDHFGSNPENTKSVGKLFNQAEKYTKLRNRFVHGSGSSSPDSFRRAVEEIAQVIHSDWEKCLAPLIPQGSQANPMGRLGRRV